VPSGSRFFSWQDEAMDEERKPPKRTKWKPKGSIRRGVVYPIPIFCDILGLGAKALETLKKAGLPYCQVGTNTYVVGDDALRFFRRLAAEQRGNGGPEP